MPSIEIQRRAILAAAAATALLGAGCVPRPRVPEIVTEGSRAREYTRLDQLAELSCAIVIVTATGELHPVPLRDGGPGAAPTPFCGMKVQRVVGGVLDRTDVDIVSPGKDQGTGREAFLEGGPFLVFLAPAMYATNDRVAEGYVAVGGPAGVYVSDGADYRFLQIDKESPQLPSVIDVRSRDALPAVVKTEKQLLAEGPRS